MFWGNYVGGEYIEVKEVTYKAGVGTSWVLSLAAALRKSAGISAAPTG